MVARFRRWWFSRSIILIGLMLVLASVSVLLLLPFAVSSDVVRDRLERDIGNWAGHTVSLGRAPKLTFWPVPRIRMDNFEILPKISADSDPVMRAESIVANFNLISAALGTPKFSDFRLIRPTFDLELYPDGTSNWTSHEGALVRGIEAAVARDKQVADGNNGTATLPEIPVTAALGTVTIVDGTLNWVSDPAKPAERLSAINGTINWPSPAAIARLNFSTIFRGEQVRINASSAAALLLLGERKAPVQLTVSSAPLDLVFEGNVDFSSSGLARGTVELKTPSVRRALEWSGLNIVPGEALGALDLNATLAITQDRAKLDDLTIFIGERRGIGILDLTMTDKLPPMIAGTLAFNSLDIAAFLRAFTPLPKSSADIASTIDMRFLRQLGLDLRLSAQTAEFGPITMTNLASAARVDAGRAMFDLGDAAAFGGRLIGRISISESTDDGGGNLQLSARNVDLGAMFDAIGLTGPLPLGSGSLDLELKTPYPTWATSSADVSGRFSLTVNTGSIPEVDLQAFRQLADENSFFRLEEANTGTGFNFETADFAAEITNGQAEITKGEIKGADQMVALSGVVPYSRGSLAMAGTLGPKPPIDGKTKLSTSKNGHKPLRFFLGGSWPEPVISPVQENN